MKTRSISIVVLAGAVLLFVSIALFSIRHFAMPRPDWAAAGPAADYPPGDSPYPLRINGAPLIWIVNIQGDILALSAKDPHPQGQVVEWSPEVKRFIDPLTGSNYWLDGSFDTRFLPDGPAKMDLLRYPVKVEDGILWVELSGIGE